MNASYWPFIFTIGGNILYHISQKLIPKAINPLVALIIAYVIAIVCCLVCLVIYPNEKSLGETFQQMNWSVISLGFGIAAVEVGFLFAYRTGWEIGIVPVLTGISVSLLLIPISIYFFKESLSMTNIAGIVCCMVGLFLISRR